MAKVSITAENGEDIRAISEQVGRLVSGDVGQISYHIPESQWEKCDFAGKERRPEWDGYTSEDVIKRFELLIEST